MFGTGATKSLNIRKGKNGNVVCIYQKKREKKAEMKSPVSPRDTDTPSLR